MNEILTAQIDRLPLPLGVGRRHGLHAAHLLAIHLNDELGIALPYVG